MPKLSLRLLLAALAIFLVLVPFTVLLALVDTKWGPLARLDDHTTRSVNGYVLRHRQFVHPLQATSYIFHAWVFRGAAVVLAAWAFWRGARRMALWAVVTITVAGLLDATVKAVVNRPRPKLPSPIAHFPGGSFPSGHAMTAVVGTAVIVLMILPLLSKVWRVVAWTLAALISLASGLCRVALGVHYISDVVAGWVLGAAIVLATVAAFETWRRDEGRPPVDPATEGIEPEAAPSLKGQNP